MFINKKSENKYYRMLKLKFPPGHIGSSKDRLLCIEFTKHVNKKFHQI